MQYVEFGFRVRFMVRFCILVIMGVVAAGLLFYLLSFKRLGTVYGDAVYTLYSIKRAVAPTLFASLESLLLLGIVTVFIIAMSLFFSHKIAGPLYRIERDLETIASGDLTVHTRLRAKDQIVELANVINRSTRSLNRRIRGIHEGLDEVDDTAGKLRSILERGPSRDELRGIVHDFQSGVSCLKRVIGSLDRQN